MLKELLKYTEIADKVVIDTFVNNAADMPEAIGLFSHILNAQHIWISRINYQQQQYERFAIHQRSDFLTIHKSNIANLYQILETKNLAEEINYANSNGGKFINTVSDILIHVVNHSTYHRGQVATQFRLKDVAPPVTDYIFLKRETVF